VVLPNVGNIYQSTGSNNPEDVNRHEYRREHIKPRRTLISLTRRIVQRSPQRPTLWFNKILKNTVVFASLPYTGRPEDSRDSRKSIRKAISKRCELRTEHGRTDYEKKFVNSVPNTEIYEVF
jgi:hypothetical protein